MHRFIDYLAFFLTSFKFDSIIWYNWPPLSYHRVKDDLLKYFNLSLNVVFSYFRRLLGRRENCERWNCITILNRDGVGWFYSAPQSRSASPTVSCWRPARWWRPPPAATAGHHHHHQRASILISSHRLNASWSNRWPTSRRLPSSRPFWLTTDPSTCRRPSITQRPSPVPLQVRNFHHSTNPQAGLFFGG